MICGKQVFEDNNLVIFASLMLTALEIILKGIILGLSVSMPLGPIGIILINRTIKRGMISGFFSGLGLASADTLLALLAAIGFSVIISFIRQERFIISVIAGLIFITIGVKIYLSNPVREIRSREKTEKSLWRDFYSLFALTLSNPWTIFIFVAFYSGIHIGGNIKPEYVPFFLIPGVLIGAIGWWFILSYFVSRFKKKIRLRFIVRANKIAGIVIIIIGIVVLLSVLTPIIFF